MWLKNKIKNWLFREELKDIAYLKKEFDISIYRLEAATSIAEHSSETNEQIKELVTPLLDVGVDVGMYKDHSWAVVCVKGKPEYVKFVPLEHKDAQDVLKFLKHFQKSNFVIDSPLGFRKILDDKMFIK